MFQKPTYSLATLVVIYIFQYDAIFEMNYNRQKEANCNVNISFLDNKSTLK